ncbi:MAG TPA: NAD(P)H-binding protein [Pseudonocardia sp.]
MKLAVFGATGTVGAALLDKALDAGHELRVLARTPSKITRTDGRLTIVKGDAKDPAAVAATVRGTQASLSMLGGFSDPDSIRIGTALIASAMHAAGTRRIVIVQGFHLDFPGDPHNFGRKLIVPMLYLGSRSLVADSRAMAAAIQTGDLDWTVIRAPRITRGPATGSARTGSLRIGPWNSVGNADIAELMLACLEDPATIRTAPMIAAGPSRSGGPRAVGLLRTLRDIVQPPRSATTTADRVAK